MGATSGPIAQRPGGYGAKRASDVPRGRFLVAAGLLVVGLALAAVQGIFGGDSATSEARQTAAVREPSDDQGPVPTVEVSTSDLEHYFEDGFSTVPWYSSVMSVGIRGTTAYAQVSGYGAVVPVCVALTAFGYEHGLTYIEVLDSEGNVVGSRQPPGGSC